mmetsp:Transcript_52263/g.62971  ORF Transcript_52263/g.62971 Transcript_52263/m.62971 type:complete len:711 (+) Transcript_52263:79-2211(+)|eukprot:CAMPEP_0172516844 /NCGR_PEP_ID=MMETSP1066-20121228/279605_1 /TAXON_ID=671091 /ORGANISM="Coscinodiscus wailesii, Strain CCMP2513" /LENGTH=710 /DNA_ID=CAMNT_0013298509 /DNA_START=55 /DNA_END=2187 /DNA_ORIENTATION=-
MNGDYRSTNPPTAGVPTTPHLCASCDRCRARKTKCDGARPCGNCATKYMKKNKLTSIDGIDLSEFECIYSPAKRRGPVPGRLNLTRKATDSVDKAPVPNAVAGTPIESGIADVTLGDGFEGVHTVAEQQQQNIVNQIAAQQQQLLFLEKQISSSMEGLVCSSQMEFENGGQSSQPNATRQRLEPVQMSMPKFESREEYSHLLDANSIDGNVLRSYYNSSMNDLFYFPAIPTDVEFCENLPVPIPLKLLPNFDKAALQAARFSEIALGALVNNQTELALKLSNATVICLKDCVDEPIHANSRFDVARAYFLHALFRAYRGDLTRYFKYRRVCLTRMADLDGVENVETLFAAMSITDAWAYMLHNANANILPYIDDSIPPVVAHGNNSTLPSSIASDPNNQMWIQGAPPIFTNNKAPPKARSLDALACAMRSCCDQANQQFDGMARMMNQSAPGQPFEPSATSTAVMSNQNELCSRNMVLSAFTLLQLHEASSDTSNLNHAHHLIITMMDAFLEGGDDKEPGGFTDSQIQSLMSACNSVMEHPSLLFMAGPIYHMVTNVVVLLSHLINGMHVTRINEAGSDMEKLLWHEAVDAYVGMRKLVHMHRLKLPNKLRCHALPRPNFKAAPGEPYIELAETLLCSCKGCQGFVLMACSPCVAAERAMAACSNHNTAGPEFPDLHDPLMYDGDLMKLGKQFDLDDDELLKVLSKIISE